MNRKPRLVKLTRSNLSESKRWALDFLLGFSFRYKVYKMVNAGADVLIERKLFDKINDSRFDKNVIVKIEEALNKQNFCSAIRELRACNELYGNNNELWIVTRHDMTKGNIDDVVLKKILDLFNIKIIEISPELTEEQRWVHDILDLAKIKL